ncbi:MAG: hypothetical protein JSV33_14300 [bacterium]|nr:MAG: hypothetical protein JSV33_14300 [bacterium]
MKRKSNEIPSDRGGASSRGTGTGVPEERIGKPSGGSRPEVPERFGFMGSAKEIFFFLLRLLAASIILTLIFRWVGRYYTWLIAHGAGPLLSLFGYEIVIERAYKIIEDISLNPVVFLSLVIAVTRVRIAVRLKAAAWGIVILTVLNMVTVFLIFLSAYKGNDRLWTGTEFLNLTINFFLPILLWFLLMPLRTIVPFGNKN